MKNETKTIFEMIDEKKGRKKNNKKNKHE